MKANEAPEKVYIEPNLDSIWGMAERSCESEIEYTSTDAFIEKARKWFEMQNEGVDSDGNYSCDMTDFKDFRKYMEGVRYERNTREVYDILSWNK